MNTKQPRLRYSEWLLLIISIIVSIVTVVPIYQNYVITETLTQFTDELKTNRSAIDKIIAQNKLPTLVANQNGQMVNGKELVHLNFPLNDNYTVGLELPEIHEGVSHTAITATVKQPQQINGVIIRLKRNPNNGVWTCTIDHSAMLDWDSQYLPAGCA